MAIKELNSKANTFRLYSAWVAFSLACRSLLSRFSRERTDDLENGNIFPVSRPWIHTHRHSSLFYHIFPPCTPKPKRIYINIYQWNNKTNTKSAHCRFCAIVTSCHLWRVWLCSRFNRFTIWIHLTISFIIYFFRRIARLRNFFCIQCTPLCLQVNCFSMRIFSLFYYRLNVHIVPACVYAPHLN